jgi:hypothetical protein
MNRNRCLFIALVLTLLMQPADSNGQDEQADKTTSSLDPAFHFDLRGGGLFPQGAVPGDRFTGDQDLAIAVSADGKQLFGFSKRVPKWVQPEKAPPGDPKIVLIVDRNVGAAWSGSYCFAYSGLFGSWDVLHLDGDQPARPAISADAVEVHTEMTDYIFKAEWGKWFSGEEIKAGKVAEHLAKAPPASPEEIVKVFSLRNSNAEDAVDLIQRLYPGTLITLSADSRTNSLIARGPEDILDAVEAILLRLDEDASDRTRLAEVSPGASTSELRQQYETLDKAAQALAKRLRGAEGSSSASGRRRELRAKVQAAFRLRQQMLAAEVAALEKRMSDIRKSIEVRNGIADQVIDRRVEDLLNPDLNWEAEEPAESEMAAPASSPHSSKPAGRRSQPDRPTAAQRARWEAATVILSQSTEDGSAFFGVGVVVSPDGHILTQIPPHRTGGKLIAQFDDGGHIDVEPILEPGARLAILKPTGAIRVQHFLPLAPAEVKEGQELFLVGFEEVPGRPYVIHRTHVTFAERRVAGLETPIIQLQPDAAIESVSSPVITADGRLVGLTAVVGAGYPSGGRVFALPSAALLQMCQDAGLDLSATATGAGGRPPNGAVDH